MHRAILVDPGFLGEYGIGKWGKAYWSSAINHGMAQISAILKDKGIDCSLIDFRMIKSYDNFRNLIKDNGNCWYCVTCRTIDYPIVTKAIHIIKEESPNAKVVIGGIHANLCYDDFLDNDLVDYVFLGEADVTLPKLIMDSHSYPKMIKGQIPNIDDSPFEDTELYDYKTSIYFRYMVE